MFRKLQEASLGELDLGSAHASTGGPQKMAAAAGWLGWWKDARRCYGDMWFCRDVTARLAEREKEHSREKRNSSRTGGSWQENMVGITRPMVHYPAVESGRSASMGAARSGPTSGKTSVSTSEHVPCLCFKL